MSSTFATRLVGAEGRELRLAIVIQGVPFVFQQGRTALPDAVVALAGYGSGSGHERFHGVGKIEQAAKELDLVQRRMVGGSLTVDLLDDDDGTLQSLFSPRRRRVGFLADDATASAGTIHPSSAAGLTAGEVCYIGGETLVVDTIDTVPDPDDVDVARGAFGSEAQQHFGTADQGASIFTSPPSWVGRRVKLIGYFENDDGTTTAALGRVLDTFRLEEAPRFTGHGCWQLQCSHLSDEVASRKLGTGLRDVKGEGRREGLAGNEYRYFMSGADVEQFVRGDTPTYARIRGTSTEVVVDASGFRVVDGGEGCGVFQITDVGSISIDVSRSNRVDNSAEVVVAAEIRHIAILEGTSTNSVGLDVVAALVSRLGDGTNGTRDLLPGKKRDGFGDNDWSFGAGIPEDEVDVDAFEDIGRDVQQWSFVLDDEVDVVKMLADFCLASNSFWMVDPDGQLTVKRLSEERSDSVLTVDDDVIIGEPSVSFAEEDVAPRLRLKCNYDTVSEEFLATVNLIDSDLADRYPDHNARADEIESPGLVLEASASRGTLRRPTVSTSQIEAMLRRQQVNGSRGACRLALACHLDALVCDLGDVVVVSVDVPDLEGEFVSARTARVVSVGPDTDAGEVTLVVELIEQLFAIAPAAVIASAVGDVMTLAVSSATAPEAASSAPARMFAVGWIVEQHSADGVFLEDFTVLAIPSDTTIQLSAVPATPPVGGSHFLTVTEQAGIAASSTTENATGFDLSDFAAQMPNDENEIVAGSTTSGVANSATRWR